MKGILFAAHGSRKKEKNQELRAFLQAFSHEYYPEIPYEIGFLEHETETILSGAKALAAKNCQEIIVVPLLLFPALHAQRDIPKIITEIQRILPQLTVKYAKTFGAKATVIEVLAQRIIEKKQQFNQAQLTETACLLVAHGTKHYTEPAIALKIIAKQLSPQVELPVFTGDLLGRENYREQVEYLANHYCHLIVVPFFLFEGHLVEKIRCQLSEYANCYLTETLAFDRQLFPALAEVIEEAGQGTCTQ